MLWPALERTSRLNECAHAQFGQVRRAQAPESIDSSVLCATEISPNRFVLGTKDGSVHVCLYDGKSLSIQWTYRFAVPKGRDNPVSVSMEGADVALSAYDHADHVLVIEDDGRSLRPVRDPTVFLPINSSCHVTDGILVATAATYQERHPAYAFILDGGPVGIFKADASNEDVYCEALKRYTAPTTEHFRFGEVYGQFRRWEAGGMEAQNGYIHKVGDETCAETAYTVPESHVPLIFDFVTDVPSLVLITNRGVVLHIDARTNDVLRRWNIALNQSIMPSITCHRHVAFVCAQRNGIIEFDTDEIKDTTATACAKSRMGLVLIVDHIH